MKAPNPHNVKAILALAPIVVAALMYMMMGEAVKAHAQLNRLSFCRLQSTLSSEWQSRHNAKHSMKWVP